MSTFDVENARFNKEMRMLETSDPVHAELFNAMFGQLIKNDTFIEKVINELKNNVTKMVETTMSKDITNEITWFDKGEYNQKVYMSGGVIFFKCQYTSSTGYATKIATIPRKYCPKNNERLNAFELYNDRTTNKIFNVTVNYLNGNVDIQIDNKEGGNIGGSCEIQGFWIVENKDGISPIWQGLFMDSTLSKSGTPADAKATGDAISKKLSKSGWNGNKYLCTDDDGNVVEKEATVGVINIDSELDQESENPVQNKVVKAEIDSLSREINSIKNNNGISHNSIYRENFLGEEITDAQLASIYNGTFEEMYVGSYWLFNNVAYTIAAFNYFKGKGNPECTQNHIVLVPASVPSGWVGTMWNSNSTGHGYTNSLMFTIALENIKRELETIFGSHLMTYHSLLPSNVLEGHITESTWKQISFNLMTEEMIFGSQINGRSARKLEATQLPLFKYNHEMIGKDYWLMDIANEIDYCAIGEYGQADFRGASERHGIRPYICIRGQQTNI